MPPRISVVMPVYNGERYLREAIDSILNQTFGDFELLIIDDGSTDGTAATLDSFSDPRIVRLCNEQNQGLTYSLNFGLMAARAEYIARMDQDDISLPERFEKQIQYMEKHSETGVLGTNVIFMDENGNVLWNGKPMYPTPPTPEYLRWVLLWTSPLPHPTTLIRRSALGSLRYNPEFEYAEDYDLWTWLAKHSVLSLLPEVCLHYRIVSTSMTRHYSDEQFNTIQLIVKRGLKDLLDNDSPGEVVDTLLNCLIRGQARTPSDFAAAGRLIMSTYEHFACRSLSKQDHVLIQAHIANYLLAISQCAVPHSRQTAFAVLGTIRNRVPTGLISPLFLKQYLRILLHDTRILRQLRRHGSPVSGSNYTSL